MRLAILGVLCLSACGLTPIDTSTRGVACAGWFQVYDRELGRFPKFSPLSFGGGTVRRTDFPPEDLESQLRQRRCFTYGFTPPSPAVELPPPGTGETIERSYVHVTLAPPARVADSIAETAAAQGYTVRIRGIPRLGQRVYLGPLKTVDDQAAALAYAQAIGFPEAYVTNRIP